MKIILGILEHDRCKERVREFWNMTDVRRERESQSNIQTFLGQRGRLTTQGTFESFFYMETSLSLLRSLAELTPLEFPA